MTQRRSKMPLLQVIAITLIALTLLPLGGCVRYASDVHGGELNLWASSLMRLPQRDMVPLATDSIFMPTSKVGRGVAGGAGGVGVAGVAGVVVLESCANDYCGFLLVVDAGRLPLDGVKVEIRTGGESGREGSKPISWSLYRVAEVQPSYTPPWALLLGEQRYSSENPCYDALLPVGDGGVKNKVDLNGGGRVMYWVEADVSPSASGLQSGYVEVSASVPGTLMRLRGRLDIRLNILDIVLPDIANSAMVGGFDHRVLFQHCMDNWSGDHRRRPPLRDDPGGLEALKVMRQLMVLAHEHGLDLYDYALLPEMKRNDQGRLKVDWTSYDAVVRPYLDGSAFEDSVACSFWPAPLTGDFPNPARYGGFNSKSYSDAVSAMAAATARNFSFNTAGENLDDGDSQGDVYEANDMWLADEKPALPGEASYMPVNPAVVAGGMGLSESQFETLASCIRRGDATGDIVCPYVPSGSFSAELADVFALGGELLTSDVRDRLRDKRIYMIAGRPPFTPALCPGTATADLRSAMWLADRFADGIMVPDVLGWSALSADEDITSLFYPARRWGLDGVVASLRLKAMRRGRQDMLLMQLLRLRGRGERADIIQEAMTGGVNSVSIGGDALALSRCGWVRDGLAWDNTRRLLAAEFYGAASGASPDRGGEAEPVTLRLARSRFESDTRRLRLDTLRARASVSPELPDRISIKLQAELLNDRRESAAVVMDLPPAPDGFHIPESRAFGEVPPGKVGSLELNFDCPLMPVGSGGHLRIPLRIRTGDRDGGLHQASAAILLSRPIADKPLIDGDLSDWPSSGSSYAGEFGLIGSQWGQESNSSAEQFRPARSTTAIVRHDESAVYIAIRCSRNPDDALNYRYDNILNFERLWPVGEDVVEIVLDPGMRAASPSQLYRLTVKPCGIMISSRGLTGSGDFGPYTGGSWSSGATVAAKILPDAWYVEAMIPRESFTDAGDEACWGVNFIRVCTAVNELTNWSGARGVLYDPQTLGCLILTDE